MRYHTHTRAQLCSLTASSESHMRAVPTEMQRRSLCSPVLVKSRSTERSRVAPLSTICTTIVMTTRPQLHLSQPMKLRPIRRPTLLPQPQARHQQRQQRVATWWRPAKLPNWRMKLTCCKLSGSSGQRRPKLNAPWRNPARHSSKHACGQPSRAIGACETGFPAAGHACTHTHTPIAHTHRSHPLARSLSTELEASHAQVANLQSRVQELEGMVGPTSPRK